MRHPIQMTTPRIGIIGDYRPDYALHVATREALLHSGLESEWLATDADHDYAAYGGLFCSPGSPYKSTEGALRGVQYARENSVPFIGTCGGFQHAVLEYARNVMGIREAAHAETDPYASVLFLTRIACSIAGKVMPVMMEPGSKAALAYGGIDAEENYYCNFGLNPDYREALERAGMKITGWDEINEPRIIELPFQTFFVGTLFVPQARSSSGNPHPLIQSFCRAVLAPVHTR